MESAKTAEFRAGSSVPVPRVEAGLPVLRIWLAAAGSAFRNVTGLAKFGAIPVALAIGLQVISAFLRTMGWLNQLPLYPFLLVMVAIYVPFDVAWTRLAINGPAAVVVRGYFPFRRAEVRYLVAALLLRLAWLLIFVPHILIEHGRRNFDPHLILEGGMLLLIACLALTIWVVRSLYILPALAINKYEGLTKVWLQSRGEFERLIALVGLARLPYFLVIDLLDRLVDPYSTVPWKAAIGSAQAMVYLFSEATAVAAIALAYQHSTKQRTPPSSS